jgi:hypothetical protein
MLSVYSSEHAAKRMMGLLGSYNSSLTAAYYQELLDLLDKAISSGDLSGGSAFDKSSLLKLEAQAQSFATLPTGVRVMDDSFNYPLSLLEARLKALAAEAGNFTTVSGRLLEILANETWSLLSRAQNTPARGRGRDRGSLRHQGQHFRTDRQPGQRRDTRKRQVPTSALWRARSKRFGVDWTVSARRKSSICVPRFIS